MNRPLNTTCRKWNNNSQSDLCEPLAVRIFKASASLCWNQYVIELSSHRQTLVEYIGKVNKLTHTLAPSLKTVDFHAEIVFLRGPFPMANAVIGMWAQRFHLAYDLHKPATSRLCEMRSCSPCRIHSWKYNVKINCKVVEHINSVTSSSNEHNSYTQSESKI